MNTERKKLEGLYQKLEDTAQAVLDQFHAVPWSLALADLGDALKAVQDQKAKGRAIFSSQSDDWPTPMDVHQPLADEFGPFDLDPAASADNAKALAYFDREMDGLSKDWAGFLDHPVHGPLGRPVRIWLNPPYGRKDLPLWTEKALEEARKGALVVSLLPARTGTRWWWKNVIGDDPANPLAEVRFVKGRIKFGDADNVAPFASAVVIWHPQAEEENV